AALREFRRVLRPGGVAVIQVAALPWLAGRHDLQVHTRERYTKAALRGRLERAGLRPLRLGYRMFPLFPLVLLSRLLERAGAGAGARSDLQPAPRWLDALLFGLLWLETRANRALPSPIGSSLFCVAARD